MKVHRIVVGCALFALMVHPIAAQDAHRHVATDPFGHPSDNASAEESDRIVVRVYDIGDLIATPGSYPAKQESQLIRESSLMFPSMQTSPVPGSTAILGGFGGGMGGGMGMGTGSGTQGGGFFQVPDRVSISQTSYLGQAGSHGMGGMAAPAPPVTAVAHRSAAIDELIEAITTAIEPESWDEVGGPGSISVVGQALVIGQTESVHERVAVFLQELRQNRDARPTLIVQIDWMWQTPQQHARWRQQSSGDKPYGSISMDQWQAWISASDDGSRHTASIRCFSGQTVSVQAGVQQLHVTGITPVVGSEPGYMPQVSLAQEGAVVQVTPTLQAQDNQVVIDLHSRVTLRVPSDAPNPQALAGATMGNVPLQVAAAIDRPVLQEQRLSTTTRLPLDQVTLVGGMTFRPDQDERDLYVFVVVRRP